MNDPNAGATKTISISASAFEENSNQSTNRVKTLFTKWKNTALKGFRDLTEVPYKYAIYKNKFINQNPLKNISVSPVKTVFIGIAVCYVLFYVGIRIKYPFWIKQPVLHHHDFFLKMKAPCIISRDLPPKNRYVNDKIRFRKYNDLSIYDRDHFFDLIYNHYLKGGKEEYRPTEDSIYRYFINLNLPSFFTLYYDNVDIKDSTGEISPEQRRLIGAMTTRPLNIHLKNEKQTPKEYNIYYVDWLCVHSAHRKQGKAAEIIYTHFYKQQREWGETSIYLFKREGNKTPIVPLVKYMAYGFDLENQIKDYTSQDIPKEHILVRRMLSKEINLVKNMFENIKNEFKCTIFPSDVLLQNMMKNSLIYIFSIYLNQTPIGCVFCRNSHTHISNDLLNDSLKK